MRFRDLWFAMTARHTKQLDKIDYNDSVMHWTIIKKNISFKEYKKRFKVVHQTFKYRFLVPLVWVANKILGRYIMKPEDIVDEEQNKLIRAWNKNFDLSIREWTFFFRRDKMKRPFADYRNDPSIDMLFKMNDFMVTMYMHDTAYRTLIDMMLSNWAITVGELYPGKIGNFIYNSKVIDDLDFKMITGKTDQNIMLDLGTHKLAFKKGDGFRIENVDMTKLKKTPEVFEKTPNGRHGLLTEKPVAPAITQ